MKRLIAAAVALTLIALPAADVAAWGASGHRMVGLSLIHI